MPIPKSDRQTCVDKQISISSGIYLLLLSIITINAERRRGAKGRLSAIFVFEQ